LAEWRLSEEIPPPVKTVPTNGATPQKLAFGVEPSERLYRLRLARYHALGESVGDDLRSRRDDGPLDLLDVGVGSGRSRRYVEVHDPDGRVRYHGVDSSPRRLESVYKRESWTLVRGDVETDLPFADESFDIVLCEQILEHLSDPRRVMGELHRVLRPSGIGIIGVPTFPPGWRGIRAEVLPAFDRWRGKPERNHVQVFSLGTLRRALEEGGPFEVVAARGFRFVSGGFLSPLEDQRWFWRLSSLWGRWFPSLCVEVQTLVRRRDATPAARR